MFVLTSGKSDLLSLWTGLIKYVRITLVIAEKVVEYSSQCPNMLQGGWYILGGCQKLTEWKLFSAVQ